MSNSTARSRPQKAATPNKNGHATQNVKSRGSLRSKKQASRSAPKLERTTFRTSREMDFFSEKELVTQTGHAVYEWPYVIAKELMDNSLDVCEEKDIPPVIDVVVDACGITVCDNGPGLPEATLQAVQDFTVRASSREAYVAPDRGKQGNALKTLLAMPWVLDPEHGRLIIEAHGKRHVITCGADPISQRAVINDDATEAKCKKSHSPAGGRNLGLSGTLIRLEWGPRELSTYSGDSVIHPAWPFRGYEIAAAFKPDFCRLIEGFALFNPHATIRLDWFGEQTTWMASDPNWRKWKPCQPTSPHWYEQKHIERLIGACVTHDREAGSDRLVSDFVAQFDGLTGSQKRSKVLHDAGLHRVRLSELVLGDPFDSERIAGLLAAMQRHTRPVNPRLLGIIGEDHLRSRLLAMGVRPESFRYAIKLSPKDEYSRLGGVPWVLECAFGWLGEEADDWRRIYAGANWSAAIGNPFRSFRASGEGLEAVLSAQKVGAYEQVVIVVHLADPRVEYTDRGKSALVIGGAA